MPTRIFIIDSFYGQFLFESGSGLTTVPYVSSGSAKVDQGLNSVQTPDPDLAKGKPLVYLFWTSAMSPGIRSFSDPEEG
jgi:hypothetical protein